VKVNYCYPPEAAVFMMLTVVEVRIDWILMKIRQLIVMAGTYAVIERKASNA
jgi:hypothetical protein